MTIQRTIYVEPTVAELAHAVANMDGHKQAEFFARLVGEGEKWGAGGWGIQAAAMAELLDDRGRAALHAIVGDVRPLLEALAPFAACAEQIDKAESDEEWAKFRLLVGDYRRAATAVRNAS